MADDEQVPASSSENPVLSPQLTLRATLTGACIGSFLAVANLYTMLKVGTKTSIEVSACVVAVLFWRLLAAVLGHRISSLSILETNSAATTATAAGYATGGAVLIASSALLVLEGAHRPVWVVASLTLSSAILGVLIAVPLKRQLIDVERLPFPSGTAMAEMLRGLYSGSKAAIIQLWWLGAGLAIGLGVSLGKSAAWAIDSYGDAIPRFLQWTQSWPAILRLSETLPLWYRSPYLQLPTQLVHGYGFSVSPLLIGAGMLIGFRVAIWMLIGSLLLNNGVGPWLAARDATFANDESWIPSIPVNPAGVHSFLSWGLWVGGALLVSASLTGFLWQLIASAAARRGRATDEQKAIRSAGPREPMPRAGWLLALVGIAAALVAIQAAAMGISPALSILALLTAVVGAVISGRMTGETDNTPVGPVAKLTQAAFALTGHTTAAGNLIGGGASAGAAQGAADILRDWKAGAILGADPRKQLVAQLIGCVVGTAVLVPTWYALVPTVPAVEQLNSPLIGAWLAFSKVFAGGIDMIPSSARAAFFIALALGAILALLERALPEMRRWIPSPIGLGFGFLIPMSSVAPIAVGGAIALSWSGLFGRAEERLTPLASGLVAGEALLVAGLFVLAALSAI